MRVTSSMALMPDMRTSVATAAVSNSCSCTSAEAQEPAENQLRCCDPEGLCYRNDTAGLGLLHCRPETRPSSWAHIWNSRFVHELRREGRQHRTVTGESRRGK
jgi:hypothetical protein